MSRVALQTAFNQIQRPNLEEQEIWQRNKQFKNWGIYQVLFFDRGVPRYIIGSYIPYFWIGLFLIWTVGIQIYRAQYLSLCTAVICLYLCKVFASTDPGISSNCLPILNEQSYQNRKGFCRACKIMKQQSIHHCQYCKVCIQNIYFHSQIMHMCITKQNYKFYIVLLLSLLIHIGVCVLI